MSAASAPAAGPARHPRPASATTLAPASASATATALAPASARRLPRRAAGAVAAATAALLAACATAPEPPASAIQSPAVFKEAAAAEAALQADAAAGRFQPARPAEAAERGRWWQAFGDAQLDALQAQAEAANPGLAGAASRVKAARALLRASEGQRLPSVGASVGATRQKQSPVDRGQPQGTDVEPSTAWRAGLSASYEVDLFSRVGNDIDASAADARAAEASYRSVLLALQADVAQTYFQLRALDAELALLERTVALREQTRVLTEKRFAAGDVSELDVARARTDEASTRADALARRGERARLEHALALLLGQAPAAFTLAPAPLALDAPVPVVPAGLPSALLERRPDVAAAQAQMQAATARVGLARSAIFPSLVLTADGGFASYELGDLFKWSARTWLASALMQLPVFDGGRNRARITQAQAQLEGAVASYRQSVLAAFGEVEDSLSGLASVRGQVQALDAAVQSARRAAELADKRYRAGEDSYLTLIDTQRNLLAVERQAVLLRGAWASGTVGLIRALGGGWQQATGQGAAVSGAAVPRAAAPDETRPVVAVAAGG